MTWNSGMVISPIVLCGGTGTRLWPLSRSSYPKQFSSFVGEKSLFQESVLRTTGEHFAPPIVVTSEDYRFLVGQQLADIGIRPGSLIVEPESKNTAPAILAATIHALKDDQNAILLVVPSDHQMSNAVAFREAILKGLSVLGDGRIVTFGIHPTRAETGYGYLQLSKDLDQTGDITSVRRFVEKPNVEDAKQMLLSGEYVWNSGIFLFRGADLLRAFEAYAPDTLHLVRESHELARVDFGFLRLASEPWKKIEGKSIDYLVMERANNISAVAYDSDWTDLGGWQSVWEHSVKSETGVATKGSATAIDCKDTLLRSESAGLELVGIGLKGIVAIAMNDAVLVSDMSKCQEVKEALQLLKMRNVPQAQQFQMEYRPWGWFEVLAKSRRFQVKRIVVRPGGRLSLQSHHHRAEHWIVVQGTARVTIGNSVKQLTENESVYVPLGAVHRLENPGKLDVILVEVQTGSYLGEDDIVRYEDAYARG